MLLQDLVAQVPAFDGAAPKEQIKLFAWWLHTPEARSSSDQTISAPATTLFMSQHAVATYLTRMADSKDLLREKSQYKLARGV